MAIDEGMANHIKAAKKNPVTPCIGFAAILLCQDAWSQYVMDDVRIKPTRA
jgi:hypothetical protein